jgi:CPA1 family monovalent cation:H+ antiporter
MYQSAVLSLAGIGLAAILCQWFAWWVKLPAILFLLVAGIIAGPVSGWLDPDALFGDLLFPMVSLAVALILFEGSLTLRLHEIRGLERVVRNLVTVGLLTTWMITTVAAHLILDLGWELAFVLGAVTVVTGPTVIVPMLRTIRPSAKLSNILRWEGIVIDPLGALLAVLVFEFIISGQTGALGHSLKAFALLLGVGVAMGIAFGHFLGVVLRHHWLPDYLHNVAVVALVFTAFALSNEIQEESGLLSVTIMGVWLANMRRVPVEDILDFKESLSVLLISGLFIILAARVELSEIRGLMGPAAGLFLVIQFVARPAKVAISTLGSSLSWRERALLAWIAPRGIVAAAVSALFALRLVEAGLPQASLLVPVTFSIILGTVVLQSATARALAKALGVAEPEPRGLLIVGANPVARRIAKALSEQSFRTLLADTSWDQLRAARMQGLATYYGNPASEHADRHLDLVGIGRLLGLSPQAELNALASVRYRSEFGEANIYTLPPKAEGEESGPDKSVAERRGYTLFGKDITYAKLASLIGQGGEIRSTTLSKSFDFQDYQDRYGRKAIPLFAIDVRARLRVFTAEQELRPGAGWTVLALIPADARPAAQQGADSAHAARERV